MPETIPRKPLQWAQVTVIGAIGVGILAFGMWIMVFFWVLFSFIDSVDWLPTVVNVISAALAVILPFVAWRMLARGSREVIDMQESIEIEGLDSVVGELPRSTHRASMEQVTDALVRLNELDLPYSVAVDGDVHKATVTVEWRTEELRWRTLLTRGRQVMRWRMLVKLDGETGRYTFTELASTSTLVGSGASASLTGARSWSRAKSMGAGSVTKVWAAGQVDSPAGTASSGSIRLVPADAKVPVFRILRAHGWRPKRDSAFWRQWEY
ncbi:hypothetical protein [Demequina aestuarii]|uniref:hypothetical protein n=1 Tax=Demequina aestuarii TaxID=327095 RepID=UPI0007824FB8|nr:hypothetical protein [Demequina aestuarii]